MDQIPSIIPNLKEETHFAKFFSLLFQIPLNVYIEKRKSIEISEKNKTLRDQRKFNWINFSTVVSL